MNQRPSLTSFLGTSCLCFIVIWLLNCELAPGINESHYLTKARHAWNPAYAPGDLFLESGNAHWAFSQIAGWMSTGLSLSAVAWIGRIFCWVLMSLAWARCSRRFELSPLICACVLASWMMATRLGNWAGEWAVGGFEAKAIAYPLVMFALADVLDGNWKRAWILCGMAVAFHPLVGGWAGLTFVLAWLGWGREPNSSITRQLMSQLPSLVVAGLISLVGILPALAMIGGPARQGEIVVAQIHAFYRLSHHQTPHLFWVHQHVAGAITLALFIFANWLLYSINQRFAPDCSGLQAVKKLVKIAWLSLAINLVGLLIDLVGVQVRPAIAASLLRFYWFRWADIIVPLAWVTTLWSTGIYLQRSPLVRRVANWHTSGWVMTLTCTLALVLVCWQRVGQLLSTDIAPADRMVLMSDSPHLASSPEVVEQWLQVCGWIKRNTPPDALFLTPRAQQTFKWYAERAEVVTYKDVPQDSASLIEWFDRVGRCAPPRDQKTWQPLGWTTQQISRLQQRYKFQYVVIDRRIQTEAPLLQLVYPEAGPGMLIDSTYAVFKVP